MRYRFSGARVRAERKRHGLSLDRLAKMIGVTTPFLGQIELGKRKPSLETFERLLAVFNEKPESLMRKQPNKNELPIERRAAALLRGQPKRRQKVILDSIKFFLRQLP